MLTGYLLDILRPKKIICCSFFTRVRLNNLLQCSKTGCFRTEYRFSLMPISKFLLSAKPMKTTITPKLDFFINVLLSLHNYNEKG